MMETTKLKRFAQYARRSLRDQVQTKLNQVLAEDSAARRESAAAIRKLEEAIQKHTKDQVIERVAYIWFNRFCALRFMDVNRYNRVNVVSPADPSQFQPEILAEAKMGHIDEEMVQDKIRQQIFALLDGKAPSRDPQGEAYRLLVVASCNYWNKAMPFLFERIEDYTELLMPDDLLSGNSILAYTREAMTPETCEDVEVIGWLYQFYISEKKDEVFEGLKKNKKITPENIPAATQLFTPHWIVRYLVENSLGRLWLLNRPGSKLAAQMDYYIKPEQPETDFLRISKPEEIKVCDPACGSGHMLTYAFDLLYAIYEEEGYEPAEIPEKILTHNLYGIEIDERAGELAAFALTMKARAKQRRFFNKSVKPNICVLENVHFDEDELKEYMDFVGRDLFTLGLENTLRQFEEADNFGSLIRPEVTDVDSMLQILDSKDVSGHLFLSLTHQKVLQALRQADYLSRKYHVVIANPPYISGRNMNDRQTSWLKHMYFDVRFDLFSAFVFRCSELAAQCGQIGVMSPNVWMYLISYENLRNFLITKKALNNLVELPLSGFTGATVQICAYNFENRASSESIGIFIGLTKFKGGDREMANYALDAIKNPECDWRYRISSSSFNSLPGNPIAYWVKENIYNIFSTEIRLGDKSVAKVGLQTGDNDTFTRIWHEVSVKRFFLNANSTNETSSLNYKWYPYNKGGQYRKWYGNVIHLVNWHNDGFLIRNFTDSSGKLRSRPQNTKYYFQEGITWSDVTSGFLSARYIPNGYIYDVSGHTAFIESEQERNVILAYMNTNFCKQVAKILNPTLHFQTGDYSNLPFPSKFVQTKIDINAKQCIDFAIIDWNSYETSWDFTSQPLLNPDSRQPTLKATYQKLRTHWWEMTLEMQRLEQENNRIFIDAYGLQDELNEKVELNEITLTCNPHYRYGNGKSEEELEALLLADTMRELVSYAVGCMFGRYALDKPGLILANQGETIDDYLKRIPEPSFPADDDNVIPMLDGDWFTDDVTERFHKFLRVTFGDEHYEENLKFVEKALGKDIGKYFAKVDVKKADNFYGHHVTRYKKRPIYWLFSSPNGSFNALIYMHRYRSDTVSVVLNDYLREFRTKLVSEKNREEAKSISASASQGEKTKALKEIEKINKMIAELEEYEREVLYPLATQQIDIDLDDGVKFNYVQFGAALKKIVGLDAPED